MSDFTPQPGPYHAEDTDVFPPQGPAIARVSRWLENPLETADLLAASWELHLIVKLLADAAEPEKDRTLHEAWSRAQQVLRNLGSTPLKD